MAARVQKESLTMAKMKNSAAALALAVALTFSGSAAAQKNPTLYSINQPVVSQVDYVMDVSGSGSGVRDADLYRLSDWFRSINVRYGDRIFVDTGSYADERARQDVAGVAAHYGLLLSQGAPVIAGAVPAGAVRVVVSRSEATVPGCPNWSETGEVAARISTSTNYGCATNSNLAAMIADPNDLVLGQTPGGRGDMSASSKAIKSYRDAAPTGAGGALKEVSSKGGN